MGNNGMNKPVFVIPSMREWAFLLFRVWFFNDKKAFYQTENAAVFKPGNYPGARAPPH
jgi:hypothetical protein